uniref:Adenosine deaminase RNA specific B2 (inactive) n=1 Tax=Myripristis murdjan TaxID=586833 RepID=A0A668ALR5_9TELE
MRHRDAGATSAEDADNSSTSSLEVKENQDHKNQADCDLLRKYHPSTFCTTIPRRGTRTLKRKQPLMDGKDRFFYQSHLTCKRAAWAVTQKNALVQLNELQPGLQYEIMSKTGPLHAPEFSIGVEVNGLRFEGRGPTKKQAKMRAAELALRSFIQFPNASQAHAAMGNFPSAPMDFTADKLDIPDMFLKEFEPSSHENCDLLRSLSSSLSERLGPVALLDELQPGLRYICLTERVQGRPMRSFVMVVCVEGRVFEGCGHSKRLAKAQAAAAALQALACILLGHSALRALTNPVPFLLLQCFAESIFHLVREKYSELTDSCCSTSHARHKVLAGIVMTRGFDLRSAQVVCLATGTKCVDPGSVSERSATLSDCHAEVVARRSLVRFLYSQLELLLCKRPDGAQQSVLVPNKGFGFRLRDGVLFHMYISSSPCGDARLNCPYETAVSYSVLDWHTGGRWCVHVLLGDSDIWGSFNVCFIQGGLTDHRWVRRFRYHLRVKVNGGEGTLPVTARRANQKWHGASPAEPLVTMSCTDKMAKWSVLGLQGALLSHMVEPVYLHSLTVGTLSHTGHLGRAMARRLGHINHLPFPYRRHPLLLGLSSSEVRPAGKAPSLSVNWSFGDGGLEEISTSTGRRRDSGTPSRLCRRSLFSRWQRLQQQPNHLSFAMPITDGDIFLHETDVMVFMMAVKALLGSCYGVPEGC